MGQPDLIYKFMDLANHQAALNSRRGAAYGFSKIAKQAGDALQPHLRLLIPRLIRYQYDPEKNVQVKIFFIVFCHTYWPNATMHAITQFYRMRWHTYGNPLLQIQRKQLMII